MRFQDTQNTLTFALALVAALPLIVSTEIGAVFSFAFFGLWAAGWFVSPARMRAVRYRRIVTGALAVLLAVQLARIASGTPMARAGMEFIAGILGFKMVSRGFASDYYQIVILSFMHIIAATVAIDDLVYGVSFILFVALSSPVLALSYLRQEMESRFSPNTGETGSEVLDRLFMSKRIISSGFLVTTSFLSIPVLLMTALLFVVFPRFGFGFFGRLPTNEVAVGFGDKVELGDLDIVRMEENVLIRLEPEDKDHTPKERLEVKIRGAVFDRFENSVWAKSGDKRWQNLKTDRQRFVLDKRRARVRGESFEVLLEPFTPKLLFLPEGTGVVHTDLVAEGAQVAPRKLETNSFGEIRYLDDAEVGIRYRVELNGAPPLGAPPSLEKSYLQLPEKSDRLVRLAEEMAPGGSDRSIAGRLVRKLRIRYRYSLRLSDDERNNEESTPLNRFLFSRKTGTCEHFATALTLLLRARGVPARLVTGFSGADWNPIGRFYSVRERTAHSWTEAFLDGEWVTLDATPGANDPGTAPKPSVLALIVDTLRARWHRYVIGYDLSTQGEIALALWRYWQSRPAGSSAVLPRLTKALPAAALVLAVAGVVVYRLRRRSAKRPAVATARRKQRATQKEATRLLALLERRLKRLGFPRPAARTPLEHAKTIRELSPVLAKRAITIIERYNEVRFGKVAFREGEPRLLAGQIRQLSAERGPS